MASVLSATESNNSRVLEILVAVPGYIPQQDLDAALVLAAKKDHKDCAEILIKAGADVDYSKGSVLTVATEYGSPDIVRCLLSAGCKVNMRNHYSGASPLHFAARLGRGEIIGELVKAGAQLNSQDNEGNTPLISAARNCHRALKAMKCLIDSDCNLDVQNNDKRTALHYTAHKAIGTELLLVAGANPNIQDTENNTPMHLAAAEGFDNIIKCLVLYNANPDVQNSFGKYPIHFLAMKNHWEGVEAIVLSHGHVDVLDAENHTPLWYAVNHNRPEAVKALLRANADPDLAPNESLTPLKLALDKKLYGIAKLLILSGCKVQPLYQWLHEMENNNQRPDPHFVFAEDEESDEEDVEEKSAMDWFEDWMHCPHSLRQICRITIRRYIGRGILRKEGELPLPQSQRDYITLREVEDHHVEGGLI